MPKRINLHKESESSSRRSLFNEYVKPNIESENECISMEMLKAVGGDSGMEKLIILLPDALKYLE